MATYGGQGQNEVSYYVGTAAETRPFSIVYNPTTNVSQVYVRTGNNLFGVPQFDPVGTINFNTGNRTLIPSTNLSASEERAFNLGVSWSDDTKEVISNASSSANPDQLLQPRGTQPEPPTPPQGVQSPSTTGGTDGGPNSDIEGAQNAQPFDLGNFGDLTNEFADSKEEAAYKKWNLKYPSTIESGQDRILISQYKYVTGLAVSGESSSIIKGESRFVGKNFLGQVALPMPNDLSESNSVGWGEDSLGNFAAMAMPGLMKTGVALSGANVGQLGAGLNDLGKILQSGALGTRAEQYLVTNAAASLLKKINVNVNPEAYITRATGAAVNPNLELLFNGPKLRQFGLSFKMTPRSEDEAKSIRGIIQFFKKGMAPRRSENNDLSFFLGTPNVFKVQFMGPGNAELKSIGKFKTCALVTFSVNYTADGFYAAYLDSLVGSQPISVTMQMGFTELTPVFSDEYDLNDDTVNLGPTIFNDTYELKATDGSSARGPVQGPANDGTGRTIEEVRRQEEVNRIQQEALRQAGSPVPNIPGSAL